MRGPAMGPETVEVEFIDGVLVGVVVGVGGSPSHRVDLQEATEGGVIEAGAHEDVACGGLSGALVSAEPSVARR